MGSAETFFNTFKTLANDQRFAFVEQLVSEATQVECEWLDYKELPSWEKAILAPDVFKKHEDKIKEIWSEALGGFANTQGGVLILGVEAPKGIPRSIKPIPNAIEKVTRLHELIMNATVEAIQGVQIEAALRPGTNEGVIFCFVPLSDLRPHRSEWRSQNYMIRVSDGFKVAPNGLLKNLFYPYSRPSLVVTDSAHHGYENDQWTFDVKLDLTNLGTSSAADISIVYLLNVTTISESHSEENCVYWGLNLKERPDFLENGMLIMLRHSVHPLMSISLGHFFLRQNLLRRLWKARADLELVVVMYANNANARITKLTYPHALLSLPFLDEKYKRDTPFSGVREELPTMPSISNFERPN